MSKTVLVKEGTTLLECECPELVCDNCKLRYKCFTSRPLANLNLNEKIYLVHIDDTNMRKIKIVS